MRRPKNDVEALALALALTIAAPTPKQARSVMPSVQTLTDRVSDDELEQAWMMTLSIVAEIRREHPTECLASL